MGAAPVYLPPGFTIHDRAVALELMRAHPFAVAVSTDEHGEPYATHLPLAADLRGETIVLTGHFSRSNPHGALIEIGQTMLAIFSGPHAYVSPANYAAKQSVPTWNYLAVHAYGTPTVIATHGGKDDAQKRLIADHEPGYADQWRALDPGYQTQMLDGIVVFELAVTRLEAKAKLSQNRPADDRARVHAYQAAGSADERALAHWMARLVP